MQESTGIRNSHQEIIDEIINCFNEEELKALEIVDNDGKKIDFKSQITDAFSSRYIANAQMGEIKRYVRSLIRELRPSLKHDYAIYIKEFLISELKKSIFISKKTHGFNQRMQFKGINAVVNFQSRTMINETIKKIDPEVLKLLNTEINDQQLDFQQQLIIRYFNGNFRFSFLHIPELVNDFCIKTHHIFQRIQENNRASKLDRQAIFSSLDFYFSRKKYRCIDIWCNDWLQPVEKNLYSVKPHKEWSFIAFEPFNRAFFRQKILFFLKKKENKRLKKLNLILDTIISCIPDEYLKKLEIPKIYFREQLLMEIFYKKTLSDWLVSIEEKTKKIINNYHFLFQLSNRRNIRSFLFEKINQEIFITRTLNLLKKDLPYKEVTQKENLEDKIKVILKKLFSDNKKKDFSFLRTGEYELVRPQIIFYNYKSNDSKIDWTINKFLISNSPFLKNIKHLTPSKINSLINDFLVFVSDEDFTTWEIKKLPQLLFYIYLFVRKISIALLLSIPIILTLIAIF